MKKAVAYLRVSSKEQKVEGYSIPAQRRLLLDFAKHQSIKIVQEFEDDETAKSSGRKGFGQMIQYLTDHKDVDSVLVEKTDRLYRNFKDYVIMDDLGLTVYLVKENEVIGKGASSHQKFIHGIKVLMAKNYVDNLSEESRKGLDQKASSGVYPSSSVPLGYKFRKQDGKIIPVIDEVHQDIPIRMFNLYATGRYSLVSLLKKLKEEGLLRAERFAAHPRIKTITVSSAQRILRNPFYSRDT